MFAPPLAWCRWEDSDSICVIENWEDYKVFHIFLSLVKIFPHSQKIFYLNFFPKNGHFIFGNWFKLNLCIKYHLINFFPLNLPKLSVDLICCLNFKFHLVCKNMWRQHFHVFLCVLKLFPYCIQKDILYDSFPKKCFFSFFSNILNIPCSSSITEINFHPFKFA